MIRSRDIEYVRREIQTVTRSGEEIADALVDALSRGEHLRREKARMLDEFRREEEALGAEIARLIREQKGEPVKTHQDIRCDVWYDLEKGERILGIRLDEDGCPPGPIEVSSRPMTPQERQEAEKLAEELKQS